MVELAAQTPDQLVTQSSTQVDVQVPHKESVAGNAVRQGVILGAITTGLGSTLNVSRQAARAVNEAKSSAKASGATKDMIKEIVKQAKKEDIIKGFSKESHGKWAGGMMIAGLAAGATLGALTAKQHNQQVDDFTARIENERAQRAIAAMQPGGPGKG